MGLPVEAARRLYKAIGQLAENPRPPGCEKLTFELVLYRIRVGNYRVIYDVRDEELIVSVVRVAKRNEATYRGL